MAGKLDPRFLKPIPDSKVNLSVGATAGKTISQALTDRSLPIGGAYDSGSCPIGSVIPWTNATLPSNGDWLLCDGTAVDKTIYAALFSLLSTTYNTGGETASQFRLPDFRGRAPIGAGTGAGLTARALGVRLGEENHVLTGGELPGHTHTMGGHTHGQTMNFSSGYFNQNGLAYTNGGTVVGNGSQSTGGPSTNTSDGPSTYANGGAHNVMQPSLAVNWIIRWRVTTQGLFLPDGTIPMVGSLQMNAYRITGVAEPITSTDAATRNYADSKVVGLATQAYADSKVVGLATQAYVDSQVVGLATQAYADSKVVGLATQASVNAKEPALGNPSVDGYVLTSTASGTRSWASAPTGGGGGGFTKPPTVQTFASGSGTYTTPVGASYIRVRMVGGGGSGGYSGNPGSQVSGSSGTASTFGTLLTANGGAHGNDAGSGSLGTGGAAIVTAPAIGSGINGNFGSAPPKADNMSYAPGGAGGANPIFGGGVGNNIYASGASALANTGAGGQGGGSGGTATSLGGGGGSGGAVDAIIPNPSATYAFAIGTGGVNGGAGNNGYAAGNGGSGYIEVTEYYTGSVGTQGLATLPTAAIVMWPYTTLPADGNWLFCDGAILDRTLYSELFSILSTTYNIGGETGTQFRLPDFRGRSPLGNGQGTGLTNRTLGQQVGTETHTLTIAQMPGHQHEEYGNNLKFVATGGQFATAGGSVVNTGAGYMNSIVGGGASHPIIHPSLVVGFIIRSRSPATTGNVHAVGETKSAFLTEAQIQTQLGTGWVLADGRNVAGSAYATLTGNTTIPDLRGAVIRGKDNGRGINPDGDVALGTFQNDQMQGHWHQGNLYQGVTFQASGGTGGGYGTPSTTIVNDLIRQPISDGTNGTPRIGNETRMKNVTANYFIKIN